MKLSDDVKPVTYMKNHSSELVAEVRMNRRPMVVTQHGEPKVVIMDVQSYDEMQEALMMLRILSLSQAELQQGKGIPQEEAFRRIAGKHEFKLEDDRREQPRSVAKTPRRARAAAK